MDKVISETKRWVEQQLTAEKTGHDWYHIDRVYKMAIRLAKEEGADPFIVAMAALLHDLADDKVVKDEQAGLERIEAWLDRFHVRQSDRLHILTIITSISYKGGNGEDLKTIEAKVVQDADRLDALGAIGVARTFQYSGAKGQPIYEPQREVRSKMTLEEYRHGQSSAIHHFYEKLLKLKDLMNTKTGKKIAEQRHQFIEVFLEQFLLEWGSPQRGDS
ncbi:HD domain-containing protein [Geomicrobium sp. JSM 1781026]|uniref:HD domain-containing protein n=1 Tax=Geomicrobium sp. JSM 1781026 TaxID=3344580 RepID=UPI0035BFE259